MGKSREINISIADQQLQIELNGTSRFFVVSTASKGTGQEAGSLQTPLGRHRIYAKIGDGLPHCAVFRGRRWTGEVWTPELAQLYPNRDWVLTRILWLQGLDVGLNRGGSCDSKRRYIYIHGTDEEVKLGTEASHGCVRMSNRDVITLFDSVSINDEVVIA